MTQLLKSNPVTVISTQAPAIITQSPASFPQTPVTFTQSPAIFIESLESIVTLIKEASRPPQSSEDYNLKNHDSESYTDDSEYDYENGLEYGFGCDSEYSSEEVVDIGTVSKKEEILEKKDGKNALNTNETRSDMTFIEYFGMSLLDKRNQVNPPTKKGKKKASAENRSNRLSRFKGSNSLKTLDDPIHVFIDNSNILAGFSAYCKNKKRTQKQQHKVPKLNYGVLFRILEDERKVARRILVASKQQKTPTQAEKAVYTQAEQAGYDVSVLMRVGQKEQCVDETLQLKILESLVQHKSKPSTLVLASGDGKDAEYFQGGFHKCVIMALEQGWKVEVISWRRQLSNRFSEMKSNKKWKDSYQVVYLDDYDTALGCAM